MDVFVGDDESRFLAVDKQACFCQVITQLGPSFLYGSLSQVLGVCVTAVEANVINPSIQVQVRKCLLETVEDGLEEGLGQQWRLWAARCNSGCHMEARLLRELLCGLYRPAWQTPGLMAGS